ncbi:hypothetical protein BSKO_03871 [Bryopsis sp. KO-2023]|nr:hypothetical protein BSKO_03871 [Bryopsis sp. KO-2023]
MGQGCSTALPIDAPRVEGEAAGKIGSPEKDAPATSAPLEGAPKKYNPSRRKSVSAEVASIAMGKPVIKNVIPKSEEAEARIRSSIKSSFLFTDLDEEQMNDIILSMVEKKTAAGDIIINEGEDGDNFYVIENGTYEAFKENNKIFSYDNKGAFGELALMYNCPRAATIKASSDGILWAVDRVTFRNIIVLSMAQKRQKYEAILTEMDMFSGLSIENRAVIADCLAAEIYNPGDYILKEGESLETDAKFYIVEKGIIECFKTFDGEKKLVKTFETGSFFGEIALVSKQNRQADCVAKTPVRVLCMGRDAFERLMGPVEQILSEKINEYADFNEKFANAV